MHRRVQDDGGRGGCHAIALHRDVATYCSAFISQAGDHILPDVIQYLVIICPGVYAYAYLWISLYIWDAGMRFHPPIPHILLVLFDSDWKEILRYTDTPPSESFRTNLCRWCIRLN